MRKIMTRSMEPHPTLLEGAAPRAIHALLGVPSKSPVQLESTARGMDFPPRAATAKLATTAREDQIPLFPTGVLLASVSRVLKGNTVRKVRLPSNVPLGPTCPTQGPPPLASAFLAIQASSVGPLGLRTSRGTVTLAISAREEPALRNHKEACVPKAISVQQARLPPNPVPLRCTKIRKGRARAKHAQLATTALR